MFVVTKIKLVKINVPLARRSISFARHRMICRKGFQWGT
jgi:hypothetical protein